MWFFRVAVACGLRFKGVAIWAANRLKEPSSWASVAAILTFYGAHVDQASCDGVQGICFDTATWQAIIGAGVGVSGLLAVVLRENPVVKDSPVEQDTPEEGHDLEPFDKPYPDGKRR